MVPLTIRWRVSLHGPLRYLHGRAPWHLQPSPHIGIRGRPGGFSNGASRVEDDENVVAILLQFDGLKGGWANLHELREGLIRLQRAGKRVFAYMVNASTGEYYVASVADKVYMDPAGGLQMLGFSRTSTYFKGVFDKLGVVAEFEKIEEFKSAPEAYTLTGPTEPALANRTRLYDNIYELFLSQ